MSYSSLTVGLGLGRDTNNFCGTPLFEALHDVTLVEPGILALSWIITAPWLGRSNPLNRGSLLVASTVWACCCLFTLIQARH